MQIIFGPQWILPTAALATALATLIYAFTIRRQFYWEKTPIIWVGYNISSSITKGTNIRNEPININELREWNAKGDSDRFLIAKFRNDQKDAMGVASMIKFETQIIFKHPTKSKTLIKKIGHLVNFS